MNLNSNPGLILTLTVPLPLVGSCILPSIAASTGGEQLLEMLLCNKGLGSV